MTFDACLIGPRIRTLYLIDRLSDPTDQIYFENILGLYWSCVGRVSKTLHMNINGGGSKELRLIWIGRLHVVRLHAATLQHSILSCEKRFKSKDYHVSRRKYGVM